MGFRLVPRSASVGVVRLDERSSDRLRSQRQSVPQADAGRGRGGGVADEASAGARIWPRRASHGPLESVFDSATRAFEGAKSVERDTYTRGGLHRRAAVIAVIK